MTENYIKKYLMKISEKQDDLCIFLLHRIGFIYPNEPIILIAVSANHRGIANKYLQEIQSSFLEKRMDFQRILMGKKEY